MHLLRNAHTSASSGSHRHADPITLNIQLLILPGPVRVSVSQAELLPLHVWARTCPGAGAAFTHTRHEAQGAAHELDDGKRARACTDPIVVSSAKNTPFSLLHTVWLLAHTHTHSALLLDECTIRS